MTTGAGSRPGDGQASANSGETVSASPGERRFAFPRRLRIRKRKHFLAVQARAKRLQTPLATLLWRPNEAGITRLGITTSKKVGNAPVRNRIRRCVREAFRLSRHDLPAGYDLIVVARSESRNAKMQDLVGVLKQWASAAQRAPRRPEGDATP